MTHANLGFGAPLGEEVDVDALVESCYKSLADAQDRGVNMEGENLSKEVMRTILRGWESTGCALDTDIRVDESSASVDMTGCGCSFLGSFIGTPAQQAACKDEHCILS